MKLIIFLILFLPLLSWSQGMPPNVNTIVVKGVSFKEICMALLDSGYTIDKKDIELETVSTKPRQYPKLWNATYIINARIKDSVAYFRATFTAPPTGGLFKDEEAYNHCKKNGEPHPKSMIRYPFMLMNNFVLAFNKQIQYTKL